MSPSRRRASSSSDGLCSRLPVPRALPPGPVLSEFPACCVCARLLSPVSLSLSTGPHSHCLFLSPCSQRASSQNLGSMAYGLNYFAFCPTARVGWTLSGL